MSPRLAPLALAVVLSACASVKAPAGEAHPQDPFESVNRRTFAFNERVDAAVLKPMAQAYQTTLPAPVRAAVDNVFGNLSDAWSALNWLLQGQFQRGIEQGARVAWNTTLGLGGLFDVGSHFGLDKRSQDLGQTLGTWGVGLGPYVVLPVLGPSSARDAAVLPISRSLSLTSFVSGDGEKLGAVLLEAVSTRASLLGAEKVVEGIALDKYTFLRDAYLQRRGAKPRKPEDDEGFEIVAPEPSASAPAKR
ncbi:MAG: VacJ family lipoprotein [Rubrivivax sp.]|nr:VacJ family lipoprotein [Rubrivivax sp.]